VHAPSTNMTRLARLANASPSPGEELTGEPRIESDHQEISTLARQLTAGVTDERDQFETLFRYVDNQISNEPSTYGPGMTSVECLKAGAGDARAQSRLLVALCRNRGIQSRLVWGLTLRPGQEQQAHVWAEGWVHNHWVAACPFYHHLGHIPSTYLVFGYGDVPVVRSRKVSELDCAFLVERSTEESTATEASPARKLFARISLFALPPAEQ